MTYQIARLIQKLEAQFSEFVDVESATPSELLPDPATQRGTFDNGEQPNWRDQ